MWALRNLQRTCLKSAPHLLNRQYLLREVRTGIKCINEIHSKSASGIFFASHPPWGSLGGSQFMSTTRGNSMRSKVEKRMRRETGKTLREMRRAKKLRKKLMTDDERLIYNLRRAKKKVALLLQKLKKYELPDLPAPKHDPELLTSEQLQAYKKIGFRNKNYVEVGVRGVFGGVVQNMHMHWKFHETVQVCCDNFPKEKIKEMGTMLARLSGGIVVNIHNVKTIIMFRGRNYRQPKNLIPVNTLTKRKALFKARFEQALESQKLNIKNIEQQLRRKGVNPEDPIAMASIQRVAATFFRAIDDKQGTPYVFKGDRQTTAGIEEVQGEDPSVLSDDSDQEELDRFIQEIEDAADQEWAEEEAQEKEELSKIKYWGKEDKGKFNRASGWGDSYGIRAQGRDFNSSDGRQRTTEVHKWNGEEENSEGSEIEDWKDDGDDEIDDAVANMGSDEDTGYESQDVVATQRERRNIVMEHEKSFRNRDTRRPGGNTNKAYAGSGSKYSDNETDDTVMNMGSDEDIGYESEEILASQRERGNKVMRQGKSFRSRDGRGPGSTTNEVYSESYAFEDSDDDLSESDDRKECGSVESKCNIYDYYSGSDEDSDGNIRNNSRVGDSKKKEVDESWDSD